MKRNQPRIWTRKVGGH